MDDESLPTIAILGAGPIGLEAALYARFLGYKVDVYERGRVGEQLIHLKREPLLAPFEFHRSPLGLAALASHDPAYRPDDTALITCRKWLKTYLRPLAETDLLADVIHEHTAVVGVERVSAEATAVDVDAVDVDAVDVDAVDVEAVEMEAVEMEAVEMDAEGRTSFRIHLVKTSDDSRRAVTANVVMDATGFQPDCSWYGALRVRPSESTGRFPTWKLHLPSDAIDDGHLPLDPRTTEIRMQPNPEPGYFVVGAKSFGRDHRFLFRLGLQQIRQIFAQLGGRATLDLYAHIAHLVPQSGPTVGESDG